MNGREDSHTYKHTRIQTHTQTESSGIEIAKQMLVGGNEPLFIAI